MDVKYIYIDGIGLVKLDGEGELYLCEMVNDVSPEGQVIVKTLRRVTMGEYIRAYSTNAMVTTSEGGRIGLKDLLKDTNSNQ